MGCEALRLGKRMNSPRSPAEYEAHYAFRRSETLETPDKHSCFTAVSRSGPIRLRSMSSFVWANHHALRCYEIVLGDSQWMLIVKQPWRLALSVYQAIKD